jgi:hypothetical protein
MRRSITSALVRQMVLCCVLALSAMAFADVSAAQQRGPDSGLNPAPAPLLGAGLPLAGGTLLVLMLARRFFRKR